MATSSDQPVVISGCGWVAPAASGCLEGVLSAAARDPSKALRPRGMAQAAPDLPTYAASGSPEEAVHSYLSVAEDSIDDRDGLSKEVLQNKGAWMAASAVRRAVNDAGVALGSHDSARVGLAVGCGLAGLGGMIEFADEVRAQSARFVSPIHFPQTVGNYIAGAIARALDIRGPSLTVASGCASSLDAIVAGWRMLTDGSADLVLAGGVEELSPEIATSIRSNVWLPAEGACFFVLERESRPGAQGPQSRSPALLRITGSRSVAAKIGDHAEAQHVHGLGTDEDDSLSACGSGGAPQLVSTAGLRIPGAICIESWLGTCIGAAGAAALAAAIGAVQGLTVPFVAHNGRLEVMKPGSGHRTFDAHRNGDWASCTVVADADGACNRILDVEIARDPNRHEA